MHETRAAPRAAPTPQPQSAPPARCPSPSTPQQPTPAKAAMARRALLAAAVAAVLLCSVLADESESVVKLTGDTYDDAVGGAGRRGALAGRTVC